MSDIQEALDYADTFKKPDGLSNHECLIVLATAYREKCAELASLKAERDSFKHSSEVQSKDAHFYFMECMELKDRYNRLFEVAKGMYRSLCAYIDRDLRNDDWYDAEKQINSFSEELQK